MWKVNAKEDIEEITHTLKTVDNVHEPQKIRGSCKMNILKKLSNS